MQDERQREPAPRPPPVHRSGTPPTRATVERIGHWALVLLPGALAGTLAAWSGGFFPDTTAAAAIAVLAALLVRMALAARPFAGLGVGGGLAVAALTLLAAWTLVSSWWSDAPARAVLEYDRTLLYAALLALFATVGARTRSAAAMVSGLAVVLLGVCLAGLALWLVPSAVPFDSAIPRERLAWPLGYWNAMGLAGGLAAVWCLHLSSASGTRALRLVGAAGVPVAAATLYLSVSRGAALATVIGLVAYGLLARPRGLVTGGLVAAVAAVAAVLIADGAEAVRADELSAGARAAGREAAALLAGLAALAALARLQLEPVDRRLARVTIPRPSPRAAGIAAAVAVGVLVATTVVLDAPGRVGDAYERFVSTEYVPGLVAPSERFTRLENNFRVQEWRATLVEGFEPRPVTGAGAGTYRLQWQRFRAIDFNVLDAHSLYFETLGELGIVGLALVLITLGLCLGALALRATGRHRGPWAALAAGGVTWAVAAGYDWMWELPGLTAWVFAAGGLALGHRPAAAAGAPAARGRGLRVAAGLCCIALMLMPLKVMRSQLALGEAIAAFRAGDCSTTIDRALAANAALDARPEPFELLAWCDVRLNRPDLALRAAQAAVRRDPGNWELHYTRALTRAVAGRDPRPAALDARRRNPREPLAHAAVEWFSNGGPDDWRRRALDAPLALPPED